MAEKLLLRREVQIRFLHSAEELAPKAQNIK
jgi:hypothetical protein